MKRLALVGMPNTGKSTFFNRLTGASARVGNWPGVTVDLYAAKILLGESMVEVVDLPGLYDLHGYSGDEQVVRRFLESQPVDALAVVLNAGQIEHQLPLALQLTHLGLPLVVLLNMSDEARAMGLSIDAEGLAAGLSCRVIAVSAKYGHGYGVAREALREALANPAPRPSLEELHSRLGGDDAVVEQADALLANTVVRPRQMAPNLSARIDRLALHPLWGIPLFIAALLGMFQLVYTLGAPLQDAVAWCLDGIRTLLLEPLAGWLPAPLYGLLVEGAWDGLATVASFVPVIVLFFLAMALIEDSGYLSRIAFLTDALMSRLGLDGRGFVMLLMGFGCNVPALMGTRVMRERRLRWLTMLIIPLSLCSARLQVFVFLTTALFTPHQAPWVLAALYLVSFVAAFVTAWLGGRVAPCHEPFVLELPPYRLPTLRQIALRSWQEVHHFLMRATRFIVIGVTLVWVLTHYPHDAVAGGPATLAGMFGQWMEPLLAPLGIDQTMAVVLLFGFVAKEIVLGALAVLVGADGDALTQLVGTRMDAVQGFSLMLFVLLYTPCLSTVATLKSETRSLAFTTVAVVWPLLLAWGASFAFYQGARLLGF